MTIRAEASRHWATVIGRNNEALQRIAFHSDEILRKGLLDEALLAEWVRVVMSVIKIIRIYKVSSVGGYFAEWRARG